jgi:hypothetical protein
MNELNFFNDLSSRAFKNFSSINNNELFYFLLNLNEPIDEVKKSLAENKMNDCINTLIKKTCDKSEQEKINIITSYVQKNFLKLYTFNSNFFSIFDNGNYNNLNEMSLYTIVLNKLNVPFEVIEDANSIYLNVYPATKKIKIKSKDNEKVYFVFTDHFKKKFALSLYYNHSIAREELEKSSDEVLFDKYYFSNGPISLKALASLYYRNSSFNLMEQKKVTEGLIDIKKNYFLYPSPTNQFTLKYHLFNTLGSENYTSIQDIDKLILLCRLNNMNDPEITGDFVIAEHKRFVETYLATKQISKVYEDHHQKIVNAIESVKLKNTMIFDFNFAALRLLSPTEPEQSKVFYYCEKAYQANPDSKDLQSYIIHDFSMNIMKLGDSESVLLLIEEYNKRFEFVKKASPFLRVKINCLLDLAYKSFNKGLMDKGNEYLNLFYNTFENVKITPEATSIENAFLEAARNYYIAGNKLKAKEYLNKGLILAPGSVKIKEKLKMVN